MLFFNRQSGFFVRSILQAKGVGFSTSALLEDILRNPYCRIIMPLSLVCLKTLSGAFSLNTDFILFLALEGFTESLRKEMSPEWKIQATIIEPGGFDTKWRTNISVLPPHPAYEAEDSPTSQYRAMLSAIPFIGSPERAAKAFVNLAEEQDLPLRIQFGSDALAIVRHTARKTISDSEKWEAASHSTNVDGIDPKEYTKNLLVALG